MQSSFSNGNALDRFVVSFLEGNSNCLSLDRFSRRQIDLPVVPMCRSPLACDVGQITPTASRVSSERGALAIVTNVGRDAVDANGARDECAKRGRRSRVVLMPLDAGINSAVKLALHAGDGGKKARSPERARKKPLKPFAQEKPERFGEPVATTLVCFLFCTRGFCNGPR